VALLLSVSLSSKSFPDVPQPRTWGADCSRKRSPPPWPSRSTAPRSTPALPLYNGSTISSKKRWNTTSSWCSRMRARLEWPGTRDSPKSSPSTSGYRGGRPPPASTPSRYVGLRKRDRLWSKKATRSTDGPLGVQGPLPTSMVTARPLRLPPNGGKHGYSVKKDHLAHIQTPDCPL
jgi:hypothetical protein